MSPMKVLVADRQQKVRYALSVLLQGQAGLASVGGVPSASTLLDGLVALRPDVLLLEWGLPGGQPAETVRQVRLRLPDIIIILMDIAPERQHEALDAGADGFISKVDSPKKLLETIQSCQRRCQADSAAPSPPARADPER